jgi:RNA polymerase sigma-70 factor (ECF subfamily)
VSDSASEARVDRALVARVLLDDDRRAFEQLVRRHQGMVRAQLRRLLHGDEAAADDIAQEVFLLAWRKLDQFRGDAAFRTWLYRIAWSCFLQAQRRKPEFAEDAAVVEPTAAPADPVDLQLDFERALHRLSDAEQAVLLHCVQLGLSHEEAAFVLVMPLGTVKSHAMRGKAKLKSWLAAWHAGTVQENPT